MLGLAPNYNVMSRIAEPERLLGRPMPESPKEPVEYRVTEDPLPLRTDRPVAYHTFFDHYMSELVSELTAGKNYILDPNFGYSRDELYFDKVMREPAIGMAILTRQKQVVGGEWHFQADESNDPRQKELIPIYERAFKRISRFKEGLFFLSRAFFPGSEWVKILSRFEYWNPTGQKSGWWWMPKRLKPMDRRRWHMEWFTRKNSQDQEVRHWRWTLFNPYMYRQEIVPPHELQAYIHHVWYDLEPQLGHGWGIGDGLALHWEIKQNLMKYLVTGMERFAWPWVAFFSDGRSNAFDVDLGTSAVTDRLILSKLRKMRQAGVIWLEKDDKVQFLDAGGKGHAEGLLKAIQYVDKASTEYILGASAPSGGSTTDKGGSYAASSVEDDSQQAYLGYDRGILEETINATLVARFHRFNERNLYDLGFAGVPPPTFKLGERKRMDPLEAIHEAQEFVNAGGQIKRTDLHERGDWPQPTAEEIARGDVIGTGQPQQSAGGGAGGADPFGMGAPVGAGHRMRAARLTEADVYQFFREKR